MSIPIHCQDCGASYHVNNSKAGKRLKCKKCGKVIAVPAAAIGTPPQDVLRPAASAAVVSPPPDTARPVVVTDSTAAPGTPASSSPKPPARRRSTRVYKAIALLLLAGLGIGGYFVGAVAGLWGKPPDLRFADKRILTPQEKLQQDRDSSHAQLEEIGQALHLYARAHRGFYPPRLADLFKVVEGPAHILNSPFGAPYAYLYHRSMGSSMPAQTIVAYDIAEMTRNGGGTVLLASGDAQWLTQAQFDEQVRQSELRRTTFATNAEDQLRKTRVHLRNR